MNRDQFWVFIDEARAAAVNANDPDSVSASAIKIMNSWDPTEIAAVQQPLWGVLAESYRGDLWGAAYLINGGASDDGFEYFRGWLISQGREVFGRALAAPDSLAEEPAVRAAVSAGLDLDGEAMLGIVWEAYRQKVGEELPPGNATVPYPSIDFGWDFDDSSAMEQYLPRLSRLFR
ncbi:DUF4240 domain-containing protein [Actinocorallia aurantiaca]|uniref:DUF4240 domain-containing protein n=1 Tax=Actinocorallia aurantiaca TaxID=46204 RepID=A0ABN3USJ0_9ACTN